MAFKFLYHTGGVFMYLKKRETGIIYKNIKILRIVRIDAIAAVKR